MGVSAAFTDQPQDGDIHLHCPALYEVNDPPAIVGMDMAVSGRTAEVTGLLFRTERGHAGFKKIFG